MEAVAKSSGNYRKEHLIERLVLSPWFWVLACSFFFGYPLIKSVYRQLPQALPVMHEVPAFSFIDENGKAFGSNELKGKVYLAHFMASDCGGECGLSLQQMQMVQHRIRGVVDRAAIVSFSVNPKDTPEVLFMKARELKANPIVWRFLSGPTEDMKALLIDGFKLPAESGKTISTLQDVVAADRLVLVDQEGMVRGTYRIEKAEINKLMIDLGLLINRKKNS